MCLSLSADISLCKAEFRRPLFMEATNKYYIKNLTRRLGLLINSTLYFVKLNQAETLRAKTCAPSFYNTLPAVR